MKIRQNPIALFTCLVLCFVINAQAEPIGIFEGQMDRGNPQPSGEASYNSETEKYTITTGGQPAPAEDNHCAYLQLNGDFQIEATLSAEDLGGSHSNCTAFIGVFDSLDEGTSYYEGWVRSDTNAFALWKAVAEGAYDYTPEGVPFSQHEGRIGIIREGNLFCMYYVDAATGDHIIYNQHEIEASDPVYAVIGAWSGAYGGVTRATFSDVELTTSKLGIFDGHMDFRNPEPAGSASYNEETGEYVITGGGQPGMAEDSHMAYLALSGDFEIEATLSGEDLGGSAAEASAYIGVFESLDPETSYYLAWVKTYGNAIAIWQTTYGGAIDWKSTLPFSLHNGRVGITRQGNYFSMYYIDPPTGDRIIYDEREMETSDPVYAVIGVWTGENGGVARATFNDVELRTSGVGIFDGHADWGEPVPPGDASYNSETDEYTVTAGGLEGGIGGGHVIYSVVNGDFQIEGTIRSEDLGGSLGNPSAYLGVFDSLDIETSYYTGWVHTTSRAALALWRTTTGGDTAWSANVPFSLHEGRVGLLREGNVFSMYYVDPSTGDLIIHDQREIEISDPIYVVLGAWSGAEGGVTVGYFTDVELTGEHGEIPTPGPTRTPTPTPTLPSGPPIEQLPIQAGPEAVGIAPLTGDVNLWAWNGGGSRYWRPEADTLSNGNAIVLGGMRTEPGFGLTPESERDMRDMIAIFSPTGELLVPDRPAFFTDAGAPWRYTICSHRNDDKFYGMCADTVGGRSGPRYVVHTIANPDDFPEAFPGYPPENSNQYHTVIQVISNDGVPETNLINPWGDYVSEPGLIRGGMVRFLSNGNIVVNFEDRTDDGPAKEAFYGRTGNLRVVGAVILGPDGSIVKPPFAISNPSDMYASDNRFGLTSGDGWFAIRYDDGIDGPTIVAFDNDGNELGGGNGRVYPAIDIPELDGNGGRDRGDPNGLEAIGDLLFITHRGGDLGGYLTKFRVSENGVSVEKTVRFPDHPESTFEHNADLGVDSLGNLIVLWQDQSWERRFQPGRWEALARMFDVNLEPLTPSFCMFEVGNNTNIDDIDPAIGAGRTKQCRIAMNDDVIIAIAETNEAPYGDLDSVTWSGSEEWYTYTFIARMLENPFGPAAVRDWEIH